MHVCAKKNDSELITFGPKTGLRVDSEQDAKNTMAQQRLPLLIRH